MRIRLRGRGERLAYLVGVAVCPGCGRENAEDARFCSGCGEALAARRPERRKVATLLFCDVAGSTALAERVDSEVVREIMVRYFERSRAAIERHGGTVEKFVGDAVMAVFGVPVAHEDDAVRAVRAASELQAEMAELNQELEARYGCRIALRIGLNTGEVVAGDATARQSIVSGDAVKRRAIRWHLVRRLLQSVPDSGDVLTAKVPLFAESLDLGGRRRLVAGSSVEIRHHGVLLFLHLLLGLRFGRLHLRILLGTQGARELELLGWRQMLIAASEQPIYHRRGEIRIPEVPLYGAALHVPEEGEGLGTRLLARIAPSI